MRANAHKCATNARKRVHKHTQMRTNAHKCAQMCTNVCTVCTQVCTIVHTVYTVCVQKGAWFVNGVFWGGTRDTPPTQTRHLPRTQPPKDVYNPNPQIPPRTNRTALISQ